MARSKVLFGALLFTTVAGALAACSGAPFTSDTAPPPSTATGPTFHKDVEPILQAHCQSCHSPGNIAPFSLVSYDDAKSYAGPMTVQTSSRLMPPWGAPTTSECTPPFPWKNDVELSAADIATISAWSHAGAPEGDPKDAPPPRAMALPGLPGVELELSPATPFVASGQADQFRCFVLDPKLTSTQYVNGVFFIPGNAKVVHHAVLFTDPLGESSKFADANGEYDCFGGPQVANAAVLGVWAPGGVPIELPSNIGTPLTPGGRLVMQIHYHPGGTTGAPDTTRAQLRFTSGKPEYILVTTAVGNFFAPLPGGDGLLPASNDPPGGHTFKIPANDSHHVEEMQFTMPATTSTGAPMPQIYVYGLMPHMHLAGVDEKISLERPNASGPPTDTCLLHDSNWRFAWQRFYAYDTPIDSLPQLKPGDKVRLRCTYDNSVQNQQLEAALMSQTNGVPKDIFLGEQTLDEMCLMIPQLLVKNPY